METSMNKEQAARAIKLLCERFGAPVPRLDWSGRSRNGRAWKDRIQIGPRCWRGVEAALVHEVAHIVGYAKGKNHGHGPKFWTALESIAKVWYGDAALYPWRTEYKAGKGYAGRKQFIK